MTRMYGEQYSDEVDMASVGDNITRANFSTTPYQYQTTSVTNKQLYYFFKSNVCWDLYVRSYSRCYISFDFYDYDDDAWIPYTYDSYTYEDQNIPFQYRIESNQVLRFFHNGNAHWADSAYTADIKIRDDESLSYNGHTYNTRGFSLWRIKFLVINCSLGFDFNMNSYGPGQLTVREYSDVCFGRKILCGGKGDPDDDDQNLSTSTSSVNYMRFKPIYYMGDKILASLDRQCIPDYRGFKT